MSGNSCGDELSAGTALKKGPWTAGEDAVLMEYVKKHGEGNWNAVQRNTGLSRCGKSCRLRWANHLRPNLKKGSFSPEEERLILELHAKLGNKWARMAAQLPGRTDNEIKNYWNTRIKRRQRQGLPLYPPDIQRQASAKHNLQTPATSVNPTITSPLPLLDPTISCFHETGRSLLTSVQHHYQQPQQHAQTFIFDGFQVPPPFTSPMPLFHQCLQQQQQLQQQHFKPLFTSGMAAPISATLELPSSQVPKPAHSLAATIDKSPPSLLDQCNGPLIGSLMLGTQQMASQGGDSCFTHPGNGKQDEWFHTSTLPLASFSQWDSPPPSIVSKLKKEETREMQAVEEDLSTLLGMFPAPAPIAPEWYNVSGEASDGQSGLVTDIEIGIDMKHLASSLSATSATASAAVAADQGWSLSSCSWNNMPGIC